MPPDVCNICAGPIPAWNFFVFFAALGFAAGVLACGFLLSLKPTEPDDD